ncbi:hypothetical protein OIU78_030080 [Salix suchowensis]|nr:hypothetical protein OIU78_030080 [Salix suchowensis]
MNKKRQNNRSLTELPLHNSLLVFSELETFSPVLAFQYSRYLSKVPLLRFQSLKLDQIQNHNNRGFPPSLFSLSKCLKQRILFSGYGFSFNKTKWKKNPFWKIKCCSLDQGLQPRPKLKQAKVDIDVSGRSNFVRRPSVGLCSQIEKLVLFARMDHFTFSMIVRICASAGNLKEAADVVHTLKRKGLRMRPVCSWIEVKRRPHIFLSGDNRHPQRNEIYQKVDKLMLEISKGTGFVVPSFQTRALFLRGLLVKSKSILLQPPKILKLKSSFNNVAMERF